MDFISPIVGAVTGIEAADWKDIFVFSGKVILFSLPFIALGLLVERDVVGVPWVNRLVKSGVVFLFVLPVLLFGVLNLVGPKLPEAFWEKHPILEGFWIMEGFWPPLLVIALASLYLLLYLSETLGGKMSR